MTTIQNTPAAGTPTPFITKHSTSASARAGDPRPTLPRLCFTLQEIAQMLGISYASVWRMTATGTLKTLPNFRHRMVPKSELDRLLKL
jgi:hypothetical protein